MTNTASENPKVPFPFRHSAGFGRRMEYWIIGRMLKEGLDIYVPLVDDFGIDAVIRKANNDFIEVQIKARSLRVKDGDGALFAAIEHPDIRENYYFVFYSERLDATWIMSSAEFIKTSGQNKNGKNKGKRSIWFNGKRVDKVTRKVTEHPYDKFEPYRAYNFDRFKRETQLVLTADPNAEDD